jgi:hypothetical protein
MRSKLEKKLAAIRCGGDSVLQNCCEGFGQLVEILTDLEPLVHDTDDVEEFLSAVYASICCRKDTNTGAVQAGEQASTIKLSDPTGDRNLVTGGPANGSGVSRKLQLAIRDAAQEQVNKLKECEAIKDKAQRELCQRRATLQAPVLELGWYPFGSRAYQFAGKPQLDANYFGNLDPNLLSVASALSGITGDGMMYDDVSWELAAMQKRGIKLVGGTPMSPFSMADWPEGLVRPNSTPLPYPVTGIAARANGATLINQDPAATFYLAMLSIHSGDDLALKHAERLMLLLWVIENRRADLLPAFTLGPWNTWLGRSRLSGYMGPNPIFNSWSDIEAAIVYKPQQWFDVLKNDMGKVDGGGQLLTGLSYKNGELPIEKSFDDILNMDAEEERHARFLRGYSNLNQMNIPTDELARNMPSKGNPGNLLGNFIAIRDAWYRRTVELGQIPPPIKGLKAYDWEKNFHDRQLAALGMAVGFGTTMLASVAGMGAGGAIGTSIGGMMGNVFGKVWEVVGSYITTAWNGLTQSGIVGFVTKYAVPNVITGLQMTGNRVPPLLKEVGGLDKVSASDLRDAYSKWAKQTSDTVGKETGKVLSPPATIKF